MAKKSTKKSEKKHPSKSTAKGAAGEKPGRVETEAKKSAPMNQEKKELIAQLNSLVANLNEVSIAFLIRQADVLLHNTRVEEERTRFHAHDERLDKHISPTPADKDHVHVKEGEDGSFFVIAINTARNFFALDEMRKLVKICHAAENERDAGERLFNWFSREKGEVIKNTRISGPGDPALVTIYKYIINNYDVKE